MNAITNNSNIPLALAVWLVHDEYDYINEPNYISATKLMKPTKQVIMASRVPPEAMEQDVEDYISRALGHAIHDSMEKAWKVGYRTNLKKLGYPDKVIDRVIINPTDAQLDALPDAIPVYLEQRMFRRHRGYIIGGKFDAITEGIINDTKSTSAWAAAFGSKDDSYQEQGSIYRWLDAEGFTDVSCEPEYRFRPRVTEDFMRVNWVFTDWQKAQAKQNQAYPQRRVAQKEINLLSVEEGEAFINRKLDALSRFKDAPEGEIPECTREELWMSDPKYKFYKDPAKANQPGARSTKNFDCPAEASRFQQEKHGGQGVIVTIESEPKACGYCAAFDICEQRKALGAKRPE